jgi:hypothetical protein
MAASLVKISDERSTVTGESGQVRSEEEEEEERIGDPKPRSPSQLASRRRWTKQQHHKERKGKVGAYWLTQQAALMPPLLLHPCSILLEELTRTACSRGLFG